MSLDKATVSPSLYFNPCPTRFPGKGALSCKPGRHTPCCATRKICPYMLNIKFHQLTHNFSPSDDPNTAPRSHRALSRWTPCSRHRWGTAPHLSPPGFLEGWKKYLSCFPPPCMLHAITTWATSTMGSRLWNPRWLYLLPFWTFCFYFISLNLNRNRCLTRGAFEDMPWRLWPAAVPRTTRFKEGTKESPRQHGLSVWRPHTRCSDHDNNN